MSRAHRLGQTKTVLVIRLVSHGPEREMKRLTGGGGGGGGVDGGGGGDGGGGLAGGGGGGGERAAMKLSKGFKQSSLIPSVEQKMLQTAAQKLITEKLVLAHGMFDMGTATEKNDKSLNRIKDEKQNKSQSELKKEKEKDSIVALFEADEGDDLLSEMERSSASEVRFGKFFFKSDLMKEKKGYSEWLKNVCERGPGEANAAVLSAAAIPSLSTVTIRSTITESAIDADENTNKTNSTNNPNNPNNPNILSIPTISYPISDGVFDARIMDLYDSRLEITDWCAWLRAVAVSQRDKSDLDAISSRDKNILQNHRNKKYGDSGDGDDDDDDDNDNDSYSDDDDGGGDYDDDNDDDDGDYDYDYDDDGNHYDDDGNDDDDGGDDSDDDGDNDDGGGDDNDGDGDDVNDDDDDEDAGDSDDDINKKKI